MSSNIDEEQKTLKWARSMTAARFYGKFTEENECKCGCKNWRASWIWHMEVAMTSQIVYPVAKFAYKHSLHANSDFQNSNDSSNSDENLLLNQTENYNGTNHVNDSNVENQKNVDVTHEYVQIGFLCYKCMKKVFVTYEMGCRGKRETFASYTRNLKYKDSMQVDLLYLKIHETYNEMWNDYNILTKNCKHWARDFYAALNSIQFGPTNSTVIKMENFLTLCNFNGLKIENQIKRVNESILFICKKLGCESFEKCCDIIYYFPVLFHYTPKNREKILQSLDNVFTKIANNLKMFDLSVKIIFDNLKPRKQINGVYDFIETAILNAQNLICQDLKNYYRAFHTYCSKLSKISSNSDSCYPDILKEIIDFLDSNFSLLSDQLCSFHSSLLPFEKNTPFSSKNKSDYNKFLEILENVNKKTGLFYQIKYLRPDWDSKFESYKFFSSSLVINGILYLLHAPLYLLCLPFLCCFGLNFPKKLTYYFLIITELINRKRVEKIYWNKSTMARYFRYARPDFDGRLFLNREQKNGWGG